ncbi:MAG: hypothetical protein KF851_08790 [Pirellulaceae bacterium]|nr:hypothetical protein [Pirellulaceae bacterium]
MKLNAPKSASWRWLCIGVLVAIGLAGESALSFAQEKRTQKVNECTFDDIKFDMEIGGQFSDEMLTDKIRGYEGQTMRIRGFIRPSFKQSGLTKFVFVRDNQECCFGPGAALYDCIMVQLADGQETEYTLRPVTLRGTFYFREYLGPDGEIWAIYRMKDAYVE